jgi:sugar lactone lactonase YvrE
MQIDPTNGNRKTIFGSIQRTSYGLALGTNGAVIAAFQQINNNTPVGGTVVGVDPTTGNDTTISSTNMTCSPMSPNRGAGPVFLNPIGITVDRIGLIIFSDVLVRSLFIVDQATGDRTVLPNSRTGGGNELYAPKGAAVSTNGMIVVADDGDSTADIFGANNNRYPLIVQVTPGTGGRLILSAGSNTGAPRGTGSNFDRPKGVARENTGTFVVADSGSSNPKVVRIDPASGNRTILSSSSVGTGATFVSPYGIAVENSGSFIVTDTGLNAVFRVDPTTGNRTVLSGSGAGTGPAFSQLRGVTALQDGTIVVADANLGAVLLVNGSTGSRTVLSSSSVGTGPALGSPCGISGTWQGDLLVVDNATAAVYKVKRSTGNRTVVSSASVGSGPCVETAPEFLVAAPPLQLAPPQRLVGGAVQFNLYSPIGRQCVIDVSSNLTAWIQLTNFTTISSTNAVLDPGAASQQKRFYRAHFVP